MNQYCMFKGQLVAAAPYFDEYHANPHYVITVSSDGTDSFNIVVNSSSTVSTNGSKDVYSLVDLHFADPIIRNLDSLASGLYESNFPKLDYWQDHSLVNLKLMRDVPYEDEDGSRFDINDTINDVLTIDESQPFEMVGYQGGERKFWKPTSSTPIMVYGFGFLFLPAKDGLHETHMNQGNPRSGGHAKENGIFQDGAVIVQKSDGFAAMFTAFQSQYVPTNATGYPTADAVPLAQYIANL